MEATSLGIKTDTIRPFHRVSIDFVSSHVPPAFDGYRIVQLSDLHYGPCTKAEHLSQMAEIAAAAKPDLVVLTGDYIQYSTSGLRNLFATKVDPDFFRWKQYRRMVRELAIKLNALVEPLNPPDGMVGVFGNHDYSEGIGTIRRTLFPGTIWLRNSSTSITRENAEIRISGVDDLRLGKPDLLTTLHGAVRTSEQQIFKLLLCHSPDVTVLPRSSLLRFVHLVLCGHTHGGQICFPGLGPIVTRTRQKRFISGLHNFQGTPIYINRGTGYGGIPVRLFCPPEITCIKLQHRTMNGS